MGLGDVGLDTPFFAQLAFHEYVLRVVGGPTISSHRSFPYGVMWQIEAPSKK